MTNNLDVSKAIQAKSDQLNASDLIAGPITIKIRDVAVESSTEQPIHISYEGDNNRPWKPCKTAARCLASIWGSNATNWIGMSCTIYNDTTVTWAGAAVGGVRVSHMQGLDKPQTLQLTKTRGKKGSVVIHPLVMDETPKQPELDTDSILTEVRAVCTKGKAAFTEWWQSASPDKRGVVKPIMEELKEITVKADFVPEAESDEEVPM